MIDFTKLGLINSDTSIEPRDIFMSLPEKNEGYEYPRDVQSEVWKQWFELRNEKNTIIKMNTGSGKTIVGIIILKSCLDEGKGPAVYVVPDNYLVQQVCNVATDLGIDSTTDYNDYNFINNKSILVINIQTLVNGMSAFGMRSSNNIPIGSIIIDDVHACMEKIEEQFTIKIPLKTETYSEIIKIFDSDLESYYSREYEEIKLGLSFDASILVPFWIWQKKFNKVSQILSNYCNIDYKNIYFNYPLIKDCLDTCNCMISHKEIEITPKSIPISKIKSFENSQRRIFMSATLEDDSIFVNTMGLEPSQLENIITPEKANDIGDRLMIFPQLLNYKISDEEIKDKIKSVSLIYNVVVIVPSFYRLKFWEEQADMLLDKNNIEEGVKRLTSGKHVGLTIIVNKYDGIDLPDDACRIIVIDGLPNTRSKYDKFIEKLNPNNKRILSERIQKIEQGIGRGVRSNNDYCVAVFIGNTLVDTIVRSKGIDFFSKTTQMQYNISKNMWNQIIEKGKNPSIDEIFSLIDYSLGKTRNKEWVSYSKNAIASIRYKKEANIDNVSIAIRNAFDKSCVKQYSDAINIIDKVNNEIQDRYTKGYLMQLKAEYVNFTNLENAQEILRSALQYNSSILKPIKGIQYQKLFFGNDSQASQLIKYIDNENLNQNTYILKINSILSILKFIPNTSNEFENAVKDISFMLGIHSTRPEQEQNNGGPDNLWAIGNKKYLIIECKNGTTTDLICKHDCNQLSGSINWFNNEYKGNGFTGIPIMIHNSLTFGKDCSPTPDMRIMTPENLKNFCDNVQNFAECLTSPKAFRNPKEIDSLLKQFNFYGTMIVNEYTQKFKVI